MSKRKQQPQQPQDIEQEEKNLTKLLDIVEKDIDNLVAIRLSAEREADRHQHLIERVTFNLLGRPYTLYAIMLIVLCWIIYNIICPIFGLQRLDPPPFSDLQGMVSFIALLTTTAVLITQNRQGRLNDQRSHLDLEMSLLVERKVSKVIELLEELRQDIPQVKDRRDPQAEVMKESADPAEVLSTFQQNYEEVVNEGQSLF
ncbi:DUF1003 domain-containing protein [Dictyobacter aurantiacus]|uniref:DUF1003 domain-containing protein n=1 Tax=Dictyobacter aurantiacus TaxID=1936993 RepID=A0A401ZAG3_9CHLR|nr:DUF1003 domain-containing protein [Dictyobacter aurantiacus]GCE03796.1 hypothetical protein KDAU_11250 [Dictyobacter aurantiacus]